MRAALRPAALAAGSARLSFALLSASPPGGAKTWTRINHRGEPITLLEGPAVAIGSVAGALAADASPRGRAAMVLAGTGAAAFGSYDDLAGSSSSRGFRGHLRALQAGEVTTGVVKLGGIGVTGLAAALLAGQSAGDHGDSGRSAALAMTDTVINAGLVAGGANLLNLFDLRPGRAIKVALGAGGLLAVTSGRAGGSSAAPLAAAAAMLPEDLGERSMLGDAGANALGAMLGLAAASTLSRRARLAVLAAVVGLTAASEVVSFTSVIEHTGPLHRLDMLGRRPAGAHAAQTSSAAAATGGAARDGAGTDSAAADAAAADAAARDAAAADAAARDVAARDTAAAEPGPIGADAHSADGSR